jgi:ribosomal protein S18 acetylase RimI-like enzyme
MTATPVIMPASTAEPVDPAGEAVAMAGLIADAFQSLPPAAWLVPDPASRARLLAGQFAILAEHALAHGLVHRTADGDGVAVWFPREEPGPEPADYERRLAAACGEATPRFLVLDAVMEENHPTDPHHHLAFLAVRPGRQGRGLGTALLRHHHATLDACGIPAYLEASSERNVALYRRHGYRAAEPFRLPDGTPFWPMWREPRGPAPEQQQR